MFSWLGMKSMYLYTAHSTVWVFLSTGRHENVVLYRSIGVMTCCAFCKTFHRGFLSYLWVLFFSLKIENLANGSRKSTKLSFSIKIIAFSAKIFPSIIKIGHFNSNLPAKNSLFLIILMALKMLLMKFRTSAKFARHLSLFWMCNVLLIWMVSNRNLNIW